jgi:hypothetical protein
MQTCTYIHKCLTQLNLSPLSAQLIAASSLSTSPCTYMYGHTHVQSHTCTVTYMYGQLLCTHHLAKHMHNINQHGVIYVNAESCGPVSAAQCSVVWCCLLRNLMSTECLRICANAGLCGPVSASQCIVVVRCWLMRNLMSTECLRICANAELCGPL